MSAAALTWCWRQTPKTATEKLVLAALADRADDDGEAFPSLEWLALKCRPASRQTVKRALTSLAEQGLVEKTERRRRGDGTLGTWLYRLPIGDGQGSPVTPGPSGHERPLDQGSSATKPGVTGEPAETTIETTTSNVSTDVETRQPVDLVGHFVDEVRRVTGREPLANAKARLGKHANDLRRQGVGDELIAQAITEVVEAGLMVGSVLSVADQLHRGGYRGLNRGRSNGGMSAADIAAMAREEMA